jgi:hypothetical protein
MVLGRQQILSQIGHSYSILDAQEFEWDIQLKFYWWKATDNLVVRQCTGKP